MKKILIVEDESSLRKAISEKFIKEGFEVFAASDGEEGLKIALEHKPDMVLLDIVMPNKDGLWMVKELRSDQWGAKAKVMILTNLTDREKLADFIEENVYDYLIKSDWKLEDVVKKVKEELDIK